MPVNIRKLRRKIRTVGNIQQITRAMRMVAAARLKRIQSRVEMGRTYRDKMHEILARVAPLAREVEHPLLAVRELRRVAVVPVAADRGLCGSYNVNLNREAQAAIEELLHSDVETTVITIGRKARDYLSFRGIEPAYHFSQISGEGGVEHALDIAHFLRALYETEEVDEIRVIYSRFVSTIRHVPTEVQLLPLQPPEGEPTELGPDYIFEPEPERLFARLLPRYVDTMVYHLLLEAAASEQGARMAAMTAATDNCEDLLTTLTREHNRARQQAITTEVIEVASGAEALRQVT